MSASAQSHAATSMRQALSREGTTEDSADSEDPHVPPTDSSADAPVECKGQEQEECTGSSGALTFAFQREVVNMHFTI